MNTSRSRKLGLVTLASLLASIPGAAIAGQPDAWDVLDRLRSEMTANSPIAADFSQTFTPAGFSSGDTETGVLSMKLPACARWDYGGPFPKSYLLCGQFAYSWNPDETSGRRFEISPDEQEGLDLLRLNVDDLRRQYNATTETTAEGFEIRLSPVGTVVTISEATLTLTDDHRRLVSLAFHDSEGNRTLFELGEYRSVGGSGLFTPPVDVEWLE